MKSICSLFQKLNMTNIIDHEAFPLCYFAAINQTFYGIFRTRALKPRVLVDYTREPFVFPAEDVRITFDKNIRTGMRATDLFNPNLPTYPVWDLKDCMILEVKFNESLPSFIQTLIQPGAALRTAASKYLYCRQFDF